MAYRVARIGDTAHLGRVSHDGETAVNPDATLCGIEWGVWTVSAPRIEDWGRRRAGSVCPTCDRTALWRLAEKAKFK